jgi:DNA-binding SARP family transcriptional activator
MLRIRLFGPTIGVVGGRTVSAHELGGVKPRQILEILACDVGSPVAKDQLAEQLWSGSPPAGYVGTLESYVCVLRRQLGAGAESRVLLRTTSHGYLLDPDHVTVDLSDHRRLVAAALSSVGEASLDLTESAFALVTGTLLASEPYADWAVRARQAFQRESVGTFVRAAQLATATGDHGRAVTWATRAVLADGLSEDAGQQLMRALWFAGRRSQALRVYAELRQSLLEELGDEPGEDTQGLYLAILRDSESPRRRDTMDAAGELRVLLRLLRQVIELTPGVRAPASDARLSEVAVAALLAS